MKVIITTKAENPTQKELDKSVDLVLEAGELVSKKLRDYDICEVRCYKDGTSLILIKK